jgi:hypothetical protein
MTSSSLHLNISSNRHVGVNESVKIRSVSFEFPPLAPCTYKISLKSSHALSSY